MALRATGVCIEILRQRKAKVHVGRVPDREVGRDLGGTHHVTVAAVHRVDYVPFFDDAGNVSDGRTLTMYTGEDDF